MKILKLKCDNIFNSEYENLLYNNEIKFDDKIAIIYGPNGTGKTSLAMVLNQERKCEYRINFENNEYTEKNEVFIHLIHDQNGRNIIEGSTEDFILGDNIRKEYELKNQLESGKNDLYSTIIEKLKNTFGIATKNSNFMDFISNQSLKKYISDFANNKQKGKSINFEEFLIACANLQFEKIDDAFDEDKFISFVENVKNKNSPIIELKKLKKTDFLKEPEYSKLEETTDAINILEKYKDSCNCIVCDSQIEHDVLLNTKKTAHLRANENLSEQTKKIIEHIIKVIPEDDKFGIKQILENVFKTGDLSELDMLYNEIELYEKFYMKKIQNLFAESVKSSGLLDVLSEYSSIVSSKLEFEEEDVLFIEKFLNSCLEKHITLSRDADKNIRLLLGDNEFLNKQRTELSLSNGEQNFLSLSFELLKAKKTNKKLIVLDDPISSFDSIYKNKIAYAIIRFLKNKKTLILTHNTDLIKLIEHQKQNCFNLYYMNNTTGESNGFIHINEKEIEILLYIPKLIDLFRNCIKDEILNEKYFLISVIPFMRGYCMLINDIDNKNKLTKLMHGYETESINISEIYNKIFSTGIIKNEYQISVTDILKTDISNIKILKNDKYPLFSKTLQHSFVYLYLRLCVEQKLVVKYHINTKKHDMLTSIIYAAFKNNTKDDVDNRVFFFSKKTLLNEFNHFEMDMNIFQPAIDITNQELAREQSDILNKLNSL